VFHVYQNIDNLIEIRCLP